MINSVVIRFLYYLKPYWKKGLYAFLLMLLTAALQLPMPFITKYLIDKVIPTGSINFVNIIGLVIIGVILIRVFSAYLQTFLLTTFRARVFFDIRNHLFEHVLKAPISFFHTKETGYLMSRLSDDVYAVQGLLADTMVNGAQNVLLFIGGTAATFYIHPKLAIISFSTLPLYIISLMFFNKRIHRASAATRELFAQVQRELQELLSGIIIIKAFTAENRSGLKYLSAIKAAIKSDVRLDLLTITSGLTAMVITNITPLVLLWYGSIEIINGHLTVGGMLAFMNFSGFLFGPVRVIYDLNLGIQKSLPAVERIFEILSVKSESYHGREAKITQGKLFFEGVSFTYDKKDSGHQRMVLKNASFEIAPGKAVAIVGRSGAGKTTLISLILKLYNPAEGRILIDGQDIAEASISSLRSQIGWIPQDTFLFAGTVWDNIHYGRPGATDQEVRDAASQAAAHGFIEKLPQGYQTKVGERGCTLSGGQRQRIAIARALLKDPKILIMDEATSQLDAQSEREIRQAVKKLSRRITVIIIAHRLSTVREADLTMVLDGGQIIAQGKHRKLYNSCKVYRELYSKMESA
jgi:subfamily B ATP-binding cassette protein MsbA